MLIARLATPARGAVTSLPQHARERVPTMSMGPNRSVPRRPECRRGPRSLLLSPFRPIQADPPRRAPCAQSRSPRQSGKCREAAGVSLVAGAGGMDIGVDGTVFKSGSHHRFSTAWRIQWLMQCL